MKNDLYDSLATECGEAVNETVKTVTGNEVMQELNKVNKAVNSYAYGGSGPIPGDTIESYLDDVANVNKEECQDKHFANNLFCLLDRYNASLLIYFQSLTETSILLPESIHFEPLISLFLVTSMDY